MFQLVREFVTRFSDLVLQSKHLGRRIWRGPSGLLIENLSQGSQFDLIDKTGSLPQGLVQPGDFLRLTSGGVTVQGSLADLGGFVRVSSWVRSTLVAEELLFSIPSDFANAYRRGIAASAR